MNYLRVDKDTKVSEHSEQSTVVCIDLGKFVVFILQKRSVRNSKSLLVKWELMVWVASSKYASQF